MSGALYIPFDHLADMIGQVPAAKLVAAIGGTRLYVPARFAAESVVIAAIGAAAASALSRHFTTGHGGMWIELPRGPASARAEARRRLDEMAARRDLSEAKIARALKLTGRGVRKARARLREKQNDRQGRLF
jgi:hypothetical protein